MKFGVLALLLLLGAAQAPCGIAIDGAAAQGGLVRGTAPPGTRALLLDGLAVPIAPDGRFILGFGRDAAPAAQLVAVGSSGPRTTSTLRVERVPRPIRNLPTLPRNLPRTPQVIAARAAEVARIEFARAVVQPLKGPRVEGWRQRFARPVTGRISGVFGAQTIYAGEPGSYHTGVDIARPTGTPVLAPADGVVVLASPPRFSIEGNLLILDHGMGLSSAFLHLSRIDVAVGARVRQGERIGAIGTTGRSTGPHLHWGMVWRLLYGEGVRVDPQALIKRSMNAASR